MDLSALSSDYSSGTPSPVGADGGNSEGFSTYMTVSSAPPKRRAGRTKFKETRHPVYKGVRRRNPGRWVCESNAAAEEAAVAPTEQFAGDPYYGMDDGMDFGMQGYLDMAQGMLIAPPPMAGPSATVGEGDDDGEKKQKV
uniref:Uncharacterized protein n=1 Tax=Aegilops tauschii TaxID=37682 RepID=M8CQS0_AEGTA